MWINNAKLFEEHDDEITSLDRWEHNLVDWWDQGLWTSQDNIHKSDSFYEKYFLIFVITGPLQTKELEMIKPWTRSRTLWPLQR